MTGHRELPGDLRDQVWAQLDEIRARVASDASRPRPLVTQLRFAVISQLAEGADRAVVRYLFEYAERHGEDARLKVVLPMEREQYVELQGFSPESRVEFEQLLERASFLVEPGRMPLESHEERAGAYAAAGRQMVALGDVLLALWDGSRAVPEGVAAAGAKVGGTADTLLNAAVLNKPCIWIPTDGSSEPVSNLDGDGAKFYEQIKTRSGLTPEHSPGEGALEGKVLGPLRDQLDWFERFNSEPRPAFIGRGVEPEIDRRESAAIERGVPSPIGEVSARAGVLAEHYQRWFRRLSRTVVIAAAGAAGALAIAVGSDSHRWWWPGLEVFFLIAALVVFWFMRRVQFHARWLSYRVLAERLRTARYLAGTGVDFRELAGPQGVPVETGLELWLTKASEEVWDSVPQSPLRGDDAPRVKERALEWVLGQIHYHECAVKRHARRRGRLSTFAFLAFFVTVLSAAFDLAVAATEGSHNLTLSVAQALCIFLPVAGASIGAVLTINQHDALAVRSERMLAELRVVREDLNAAEDPESLHAAILAAARVIAPETGSWFGSLWFLDIEHP